MTKRTSKMRKAKEDDEFVEFRSWHHQRGTLALYFWAGFPWK